jgi:hypothetical protein
VGWFPTLLCTELLKGGLDLLGECHRAVWPRAQTIGGGFKVRRTGKVGKGSRYSPMGVSSEAGLSGVCMATRRQV